MTTLRPIERSLPIQLLRAREATMRAFRPMLREHGLTEQQWRVIRVLAAGQELEAGALAEATFLLAPSLTRILKTLEAEGLVAREAAAADNRKSLLRLTRSGEKLYNEVSPDSERLYRHIEKRFGMEKLAHLTNLLNQLNESFEEVT